MCREGNDSADVSAPCQALPIFKSLFGHFSTFFFVLKPDFVLKPAPCLINSSQHGAGEIPHPLMK
jgi:hypothetical protein